MYLSGTFLGFSNFEYTPLIPYSAGSFNFTDYSAQSNKTYEYYVFPSTDNSVGSPMISEVVSPIFYNDSLVNTDGTDEVYQFDLNMQSGDYQNTEDFIEYNTYTKYNKYAFGQRQFYKLTISAIANSNTLDLSGAGLQQSMEYLESLRNFIQNGKTKYFKDRAGNIFVGITHNYKIKTVDDAISYNNSQPYIITFEFIQTEDINNNIIKNFNFNNENDNASKTFILDGTQKLDGGIKLS